MSDMNIFGSKISLILLLVFVIFIYIIMFSILHKNNESPSGWVLTIEIILWITLIIIIVVNIKWLNDKDFNVKAELNDLFDHKLTQLNIFASDETDNSKNDNSERSKSTERSKSPERSKNSDVSKDISHNDVSNNMCGNDPDGEVFHVESNTYTYAQAKDVCTLLGSRLATYDEVEKAYQNGANWCSYGWSDEQLALFPIQKSLYNELKKIPGHQHDCGRIGVNGGYIEDSSTTFGVNCYGKKPYMTDKDKDFMNNYSYIPTMDPEEQSILNNKVNDILIAPFSKDKWSYR